MARQILVALKKNDRLEHIIPYLEEVAQPGLRVVFLIRYQVNGGFEGARNHGVTGEFLDQGTLSAARVAGRDLLEEEKRRLSEQKVFLAQEGLRKKGVEIEVDIYTGRLKRVVESYSRQGDVQLVMTRTGIAFRLMSFIHGLKPASNRPPMLLLHPEVPL